jgi:hypothetical protein
MQATIRIKGYDRVEQFDLGRRAALFRARERETNRAVVFKLLLPHLVEDPRFLKRFRRDVRIASEINHENLVNVLLCGRSDDSFFVAFEAYHGKRLDAILPECSRVPVDVALAIITHLACALDACHSRRLIHRDVRPTNVVLTSTGGVKLDNLTLATHVGGTVQVQFAGRVSTTRAYMSPEQTLGENLSPQSDIFSLGVVAWELLCGKRAFGEGHPDEICDRVQSQPLTPVCEVNPLVEPAFGNIVARMIEKDRTRRYARAAEVVADLEEATHNYRRLADEKELSRFVEDPAGYAEAHTRQSIATLREAAPNRQTDPVMLVRHYEKLVYLEPANTEARNELARLKRLVTQAERDGTATPYAYADPKTMYRVVLESLDASRETKESFAIKLATKLRVPLSSVRGYVDNMPAAMPGEHVHRKAVFLAGLLEELGAVARIEMCRPERDTECECPKCGSPVERDAEQCTFCQHRFVPVVELRAGLDDVDSEEKVARERPRSASVLGKLESLPTRTKILLGLVAVLVVVLLITSGS